jgi:hypothetical protein
MVTIFKNLDEAIKILTKAYVDKQLDSLYERFDHHRDEPKPKDLVEWYKGFGTDMFWYMGKEFTYAWKDNFECEYLDECKALINLEEN